MASAQVKKQEHLEAGKRRLEEFRKKKAADRAKKAAPNNEVPTADANLHEKQPFEIDRVRPTEFDGAGTSNVVGNAVSEHSADINAGNTLGEFVQNTDLGFSNESHAIPTFSSFGYNKTSSDIVQSHTKGLALNSNDSSGIAVSVNDYYGEHTNDKNNHIGSNTEASRERLSYGVTSAKSMVHQREIRDTYTGGHLSSNYGTEETLSKENDSSSSSNFGASSVLFGNVLSENPSRIIPKNSSGYSSEMTSGNKSSFYEDSRPMQTNVTEFSREDAKYMHEDLLDSDRTKKFSILSDHLPSTSSASPQKYNFDARSYANHVSQYPAIGETNTRRSRPSFLDSINVPRVPSGSLFPLTEPKKDDSNMSNSSKAVGMNVVPLSASEKLVPDNETKESFPMLGTQNAQIAYESSMPPSLSYSSGRELLGQNINGHDFYTRKQNDDFAALEQHIEDLTQEKFSLQRALEAARALAETLATENSSLTDSYNQQGGVVSQLKSDMENLQEEIKVQLQAELESFKIEYAHMQLECSAADERAKLLASEVIGLEEKALRLRSSELKLERQLENSTAEISSYKKKMSSLEKDRKDLQSTIDALKEEKKLLQNKLRKASGSGKSVDVIKSDTTKKNVSTSTEDLGVGVVDSGHGDTADSVPSTSYLEIHGSALPIASDASSSLLLENRQFSFEVPSVNIPPDQMRMIQNINALISELAMEKEELMQSLVAESSECSKMKDLNKELSRKLETQTQRLELLTAQSMAGENTPARIPDSHAPLDNTQYADEGDEVVERVLGWIMKLFPGGPSKRRTSKLL